jgi:transcriptional regulator with XRE-family HTH domain
LKQGWSWSQIAEALGVSKQAAHKRLSGIDFNHVT